MQLTDLGVTKIFILCVSMMLNVLILNSLIIINLSQHQIMLKLFLIAITLYLSATHFKSRIEQNTVPISTPHQLTNISDKLENIEKLITHSLSARLYLMLTRLDQLKRYLISLINQYI